MQFDIDFLTWRVWIGVWVMLILWVVVALEGCYLVEHFTRFTEEVFSVLISILFIYEAAYFLIKVSVIYLYIPPQLAFTMSYLLLRWSLLILAEDHKQYLVLFFLF